MPTTRFCFECDDIVLLVHFLYFGRFVGPSHMSSLSVPYKFSKQRLPPLIKDEFLLKWARGHPEATTVSLYFQRYITNEGVGHLAHCCRSLEELDLRWCCQFSDCGALSEKCPRLKTIWLERTKVTDEGLASLANGGGDLENIDLTDTLVGPMGVKMLAECFPNLTRVNLTGIRVTIEDVKELMLCRPDVEVIFEYGWPSYRQLPD